MSGRAPFPARARPRQRGIGLAELLVAVAVGALVLLMGGVMLVSASTAFSAQADGAAIDDGGRFALDLVGRAVRQAAFVDQEAGATASAIDSANLPLQVVGLDAATVPRATQGIDGATADAVGGSDVLALRFAGAHGGAVDCAGFAIDTGEEGWSIFHVGRNAQGEGELRCKYRGATGWSTHAVIDGVDTFQVLYGLDTDTPPDGVPNEFVSASVIEQRDGALAASGADSDERQRDLQRRSGWKRVAAVRVALLLHGANPGSARELAAYELFGAGYSGRFADSDAGVRVEEAAMPAALRTRERRLFASTILLRNPAAGPP